MAYIPKYEKWLTERCNDYNVVELARLFLEEFPESGKSVDAVRKKVTNLRNKGIKNAAKQAEVVKDNVPYYWDKTSKDYSIFVKNPDFKDEDKDEFARELIKTLEDYSPNFIRYQRKKQEDGHLLVIDPADVHIGKLAEAFETGEDYNSEIAVQRVLEGVEGILDKSNGFNIDKIMFVGGNDILHIDTPKRTTTSGTPQDTDGSWYGNFLKAKKLYVEVLERLIEIADVHFVYNPSNHDYTNGFFLADVVKTHFRNCEQITFDTSIAHRKYFQYGENLIGTTHGDGAKEKDLGSLMSIEAKEYWPVTSHRYFYTHHVHHKTAKDYINVCVESLRSPSASDSWHHRNGYTGAPKAIEGYIHHPKFGQVARLTHLF